MHSSILIAVHHHGLQANSINKKASCGDDAASEIMKVGAENRADGSAVAPHSSGSGLWALRAPRHSLPSSRTEE